MSKNKAHALFLTQKLLLLVLKAATHEIGHAATYVDVMYHSENSHYTLTNSDIDHLNQIYH